LLYLGSGPRRGLCAVNIARFQGWTGTIWSAQERHVAREAVSRLKKGQYCSQGASFNWKPCRRYG
jgi:hypothetical protein